VKRCKLTNQWTTSICLGGTQRQAYQVRRIAPGKEVEIESSIHMAQMMDLHAVSIEAVIEAREKQYKSNLHEFSLHERLYLAADSV